MATKKELEQKKELARMYYMQGVAQKEIAAKVEVSEKTISAWVDAGRWGALRAGANITRPELVNKALMALNTILDKVNESDDIVLIANLPDQLAKFAAAIAKLDGKSNIVNVIDVFIAFAKWLSERATIDSDLNPELIKAINKYHDIYVNEHIKI
jgi:transposase-like protein